MMRVQESLHREARRPVRRQVQADYQAHQVTYRHLVESFFGARKGLCNSSPRMRHGKDRVIFFRTSSLRLERSCALVLQ